MGLILTTVKIVAGTKIAKNVLNSAYEKVTNDEDMQRRIQSVKDLRKKNTCYNCGYVLHSDEKFCPNCGATLIEKTGFIPKEVTSSQGGDSVRSGSFDPVQIVEDSGQTIAGKGGDWHEDIPSESLKKDNICPNCGAPMDRFSMHCEYCGYESIDPTDIRSVKELREKLTEIDKRRFQWTSRKKTAIENSLEIILHKDKDEELRKAAQKEFRNRKKEDKINAILNFAIPNDENEILEFMLFAQSNVSTKDNRIDSVERAWLSKMDEAMQRAELLPGNECILQKIESVYYGKTEEIQNLEIQKKKEKEEERLKDELRTSSILSGFFLLLVIYGFIEKLYMIGFVALLVMVLVFSFPLIRRWVEKRHI